MAHFSCKPAIASAVAGSCFVPAGLPSAPADAMLPPLTVAAEMSEASRSATGWRLGRQ